MKITRGLELVKTISCSRGLHEHMISTKGDPQLSCAPYIHLVPKALWKKLFCFLSGISGSCPALAFGHIQSLANHLISNLSGTKCLDEEIRIFIVDPYVSRELKHTCVSQEGTSERQPRLSCEGY